MTESLPSTRLRGWLESDLQFLLRLRNDVPLQALLLSTAKNSDEVALRAWLSRRADRPGRVFRVIANSATDEPMGYLQADLLDDLGEDWSFGICVDAAFQGKGVGTAALLALEKELLSSSNSVKRMTLEVDRANIRAIRCYARLGYAKDQTAVKQVMVCDRPKDVITMSKSLVRAEDRG